MSSTPNESSPSATTSVSSDNVRHQRTSTIKKTIVVSLISKLFGAIISLVAFPLASHKLLTDYPVYGLAAVVLTVLSTANIGVGPMLTLQLTKHAFEEDSEAEQNSWFSSALAMAVFTSLTIMVIALFIVAFVPLRQFVSDDIASKLSVLKSAVVTVALIEAVSAILSIVENTYSAYLQGHIARTAMTVGYALSAPSIFFVAYYAPTATNLLIAVFGVPVIPRALLFIKLLLRDRPHLRPTFANVSKEKLRELLSGNVASSVISVADVLRLGFGTLLLAKFSNLVEVGRMTTINAITVLGVSVGYMVISASWSGLSNAIAMKDYEYADKLIHKTTVFIVVAGSIIFLVLSLPGIPIINALFAHEYRLEPIHGVLMGLTVFFVFLEQFMINTITSTKEIWVAGKVRIAASIPFLCGGIFLIKAYGASGVLVGLAGSAALASFLGYSWLKNYRKSWNAEV